MTRSSAVRGGVVGSQDLETLPLPARSFANIAYLVPGTEPVEPSDPTKARITAVSTGGSSGLNNELSVDGAENSDDWIGGFLQNFSPDGDSGICRAHLERRRRHGLDHSRVGRDYDQARDATNGTGAGRSMIAQAALNARFPIENPATNPKQPFSRQNYVGTFGGPIAKNKVWFFTSFENVHENASIAYSPASTTQFDALAQLASEGLITGVPSIAVPATVPIPFRDYLGSVRFDWAQSSKSNWFLRTSEDSYLTHNALVQQATLPSTGLTTHNNYWNVALSNTYTFSPTWLGNLVLDASLLHLTQTRNSDLGFAIQFPFSVTALTVSGFETFGDNQFATPITLFPDLRNQDKYQFRYDLSHVVRDHAFKFGVDFIHEPVLSGAFAATAEQFTTYPSNPDCYINPSGPDCGGITTALPFYYTPPSAMCNPAPDPSTGIGCTFTPAGDGSFSQNVQRLALLRRGFMARLASAHGQLRLALSNDLGTIHRFGPKRSREHRVCDAAGIADSDRAQRSERLSQANRASPWGRLLARQQREDRNPRRLWHLLRRSRAERVGDCISGRQQLELHHRNVQPYGRPRNLCAHRPGLPSGRCGRYRQSDRLSL